MGSEWPLWCSCEGGVGSAIFDRALTFTRCPLMVSVDASRPPLFLKAMFPMTPAVDRRPRLS